jgi:hypothetical protein
MVCIPCAQAKDLIELCMSTLDEDPVAMVGYLSDLGMHLYAHGVWECKTCQALRDQLQDEHPSPFDDADGMWAYLMCLSALVADTVPINYQLVQCTAFTANGHQCSRFAAARWRRHAHDERGFKPYCGQHLRVLAGPAWATHPMTKQL